MADISKITLPDRTILNVKDSVARDQITVLNNAGYLDKAEVLALLTPIWTALGTGPLILEQPQDNSGSVGDLVPFSITAIGTGLTYQWQYKATSNWNNSSSATAGYNTDTLQVAATAARNGYQYRCVVTDGNGNTTTSEAATLTVSS